MLLAIVNFRDQLVVATQQVSILLYTRWPILKSFERFVNLRYIVLRYIVLG